jgi:putative phosphoribosyl transferase
VVWGAGHSFFALNAYDPSCFNITTSIMEYHIHIAVDIPIKDVWLKGDLIIPRAAEAIVVFAHGSGSSRLSPRNTAVASYLHQNRFGTLLFDLLTEEEDTDYSNRFDIPLLTDRLKRVTEWLKNNDDAKHVPLGYFGASTGAAAALGAAALLPSYVQAVVSRGGRADMAMDYLEKVTAPTLLIVGSNDTQVLDLNLLALEKLTCDKKLEIVSGATHLFEEPGAMEQVMQLATKWFQRYLVSTRV